MAEYRLLSAAKLNLSLRVTEKRRDGYHNILSLFWRLPPAETLLISAPRDARSDSVRAPGVEVKGENIVLRVLHCVREAGLNVPFLDVEISKALSPGSGLGAGSGNGAAVLRWLAGESGLDGKLGSVTWRDVALKVGADVPFLFSGFSLARVSGIGEIVEPLQAQAQKKTLEKFSPLVIFPAWSVGTGNAYAQLDRWYGEGYPLNEAAARAEADGLLRRLSGGDTPGLLPNDFAPGLMEKFPSYSQLFALFEKSGARAWGITGSGGAAFALFPGPIPKPLLSFEWPSWVLQVLPM